MRSSEANTRGLSQEEVRVTATNGNGGSREVRMRIGEGIAIAGIWIGVGVVGLHDSQGWTVVVAMMAVFPTFFIAASRLLGDSGGK